MNRFPKPRNADAVMDAADYVAQARPKRAHHEEDAHADVMRRCASLYQSSPREFIDLDFVFHSPNGGKRDKITAARMKALGAKAGVPDLLSPARRGNWVGLACELKIEPNTPTPDQEAWLDYFHRNGWLVEVASAADSATLADQVWALLCEYLGIPARAWLPLMSSMQRGRR